MKAKIVRYPFNDGKRYRWDTYQMGKKFEYSWEESIPQNFETVTPYIKYTPIAEYDTSKAYAQIDIKDADWANGFSYSLSGPTAVSGSYYYNQSWDRTAHKYEHTASPSNTDTDTEYYVEQDPDTYLKSYNIARFYTDSSHTVYRDVQYDPSGTIPQKGPTDHDVAYFTVGNGSCYRHPTISFNQTSRQDINNMFAYVTQTLGGHYATQGPIPATFANDDVVASLDAIEDTIDETWLYNYVANNGWQDIFIHTYLTNGDTELSGIDTVNGMLRAFAFTEDYASPVSVKEMGNNSTTSVFSGDEVYKDGKKYRYGYYQFICPSSIPVGGRYERVLHYHDVNIAAPEYNYVDNTNHAYYPDTDNDVILCSY